MQSVRSHDGIPLSGGGADLLRKEPCGGKCAGHGRRRPVECESGGG